MSREMHEENNLWQTKIFLFNKEILLSATCEILIRKKKYKCAIQGAEKVEAFQ